MMPPALVFGNNVSVVLSTVDSVVHSFTTSGEVLIIRTQFVYVR